MGRASAIVAVTWQDLFEADNSLGATDRPPSGGRADPSAKAEAKDRMGQASREVLTATHWATKYTP
jgi:hypothetical protein